MSWRRVKAILLQNLFIMLRSPVRIMELVYWPLLEVVLWGFFTRFLAGGAPTSRVGSRSCWARSSCGTCCSAASRS